MNETVFLVGIIILLILGFSIFIFSLHKKLSKISVPIDNSSSLLLQNQLNNLVSSFDTKLSETNKIINEQLQSSNIRLQQQNLHNTDLLQKINENHSKVLKEVTEKLTKVEDTNTQIVQFAEQLQSLENILRNPKQRGVLGEYFLQTLLSNVLPKTVYGMQYAFQDGVIVDAVIFTRDKIIPIDAKFSLEGYNRILECKDKLLIKGFEKDFIRDIKMRIDETSKYVKPEENTIDIAFMFVPSDSVYQEIIRIGCENTISIDIISYAYSKKVIIVSPTSFFAYLQTLLKALNTMKVEEQVVEIIKHLNESTKYLKEFEEEMNRLSKQIGTLNNTFNRATDSARKLSKRIVKVTGNDGNLLHLEKVEQDEVVSSRL